jgi:hypothetical protein
MVRDVIANLRGCLAIFEYLGILGLQRNRLTHRPGTSAMAYECPTAGGIVHLRRIGRGWVIGFDGKIRGRWPSPDVAARAVSQHKTGIPEWDRAGIDVSEDLLRWRPLCESL